MTANTDTAKVRVLIVSSESDVRADTMACLERVGALTKGVAEAGAALDLMKKAAEAGQPFRAVIVDEALRGIDAKMFTLLLEEDGFAPTVALALLRSERSNSFEPYATAGYACQLDQPVDEASASALLANMPRPAASPVTADNHPPAKNDFEPADRLSILLVEDNRINREVCREMLEQHGQRCHCVEEGAAAFDAVRDRHYDLVLMDCQMPNVDGYEATRLIREWEQANKAREPIPIVAVTAHAMKGDRERCLACGMNDYMTKPVEERRLTQMIAKWVPWSQKRPESTKERKLNTLCI